MAYMTDALQAAVNNTAGITGGTQINVRFIDTISAPKTAEEIAYQEQKNSDEANRIISRLKAGLSTERGEEA